MIDATAFDDLARRLGALLPPGVAELKDDFEKNARAAMQSALGNLDLVTREEFDVQSDVLARAVARLDAMEARIAALEPMPEGDGESLPNNDGKHSGESA